MNKMSEDEILKDIDNYISFANKAENFSDINEYLHCKELARRMKGLLDLYQQEKGNRRMAERNYDELTKTTGRLETELEEEKKKVRATIIGRIDQVSLDDLIGDKYISKEKIKTLKENFNKKQSSFMYRSK